jgi:LysR family transcriptional regulator (chromosome initiation inhibitor)
MLILRNPQLLAFEAVARLGTTHAAAKELRLTQTGVTQRIKALEEGLSFTLFLRSRRGMSLTQEGQALLQFCRGSRELEGLFQSQVEGATRQEVSLTLIGPTSAISTRIAENVEGLYARFPFLRLHLQSDDHSDLIEKVRRGEADLAVVPPSLVPNEMDSKMLRPDRYLLVGSAAWKGRKLAEILQAERIIDFYESDRTTRNYLAEHKLEKGARKDRLYVNENPALIRLFQAGVGYGTLTESVAQPYLAEGSLIPLHRGHFMADPLALAWYPRPRKMPYFEELVRAVK